MFGIVGFFRSQQQLLNLSTSDLKFFFLVHRRARTSQAGNTTAVQHENHTEFLNGTVAEAAATTIIYADMPTIGIYHDPQSSTKYVDNLNTVV